MQIKIIVESEADYKKWVKERDEICMKNYLKFKKEMEEEERINKSK